MDILLPINIDPPFSDPNVAADSSGNGRDGTYIGTVTRGEAGPLPGTKAIGTSAAGGISTPFMLSVPFSVDGWVYTTDGTTLQDFVSSESATGGFGIRIYANAIYAFVSNGVVAPPTPSLTITSNAWHYFAITYDGTTLRIYVDGVLVGSVVAAYSIGTNTVSLGYRAAYGDRALQGMLYGIAFYSSVLPAEAVALHYSAGENLLAIPPLGARTGIYSANADEPKRMLYGTNACSMNQRVSIEFESGGLATGVLLRFKSATDFVIAYVNSTQLVVTETVAGVATDVVASPIATLPTGTKCAIQVEAIGSRLRWWYEVLPKIEDRPPDGAADLVGTYDSTYVGWGVFIQGSGQLVTHFMACELPGAIMPPPMLTAEDATAMQLAPVVLEFTTTFSTVGTQIEWEILPNDPADFPEPYRAITPNEVTSHTVYVRPGYYYLARARLTQTPWSEYVPVRMGDHDIGDGWGSREQQLTNWASQDYATGTQIAPPLAAYNFPDILPDYVLEGSEDVGVKISTTNIGRDTTSATDRRPRRTFTLKFENRTFDEYQVLIDFFEFAEAKNLQFNWTQPITGEQFVLRFDTDDYERTDNDQAQETSSSIASISFSCTEAAPFGSVVPTVAFSMNVDPSIFAP